MTLFSRSLTIVICQYIAYVLATTYQIDLVMLESHSISSTEGHNEERSVEHDCST